jgi:hypothetical protein
MVPVRLMSTTWAKVSRSYSALRRMIPAALTRISRRSSPPANRLTAAASVTSSSLIVTVAGGT